MSVPLPLPKPRRAPSHHNARPPAQPIVPHPLTRACPSADPFTQDYPENFETSIAAEAVCARFNPRGLFGGHFLAVGRNDGIVTVLDFETKGVVRFFEGHVKAVTTVWSVRVALDRIKRPARLGAELTWLITYRSWSRNSRYLLSASRDWNVIIWDLDANASTSVRPERRHTLRFDAPVTSAHLHPRNRYVDIVEIIQTP